MSFRLSAWSALVTKISSFLKMFFVLKAPSVLSPVFLYSRSKRDTVQKVLPMDVKSGFKNIHG